MRRLLTTALLLTALGSVALAKRQPGAIPPLSLQAQDWSIRYSPGMPAKPSPLLNLAGWFFDFPTGSSNSVNYVTVGTSGQNFAAKMYLAFTAQVVALSGAPVFNYRFPDDGNTCAFPAHARAYLERRIDFHGPSKGCGIPCAPDTYRWWADLALELDDLSTATIVVPLTGNHWSDTNGQWASTYPQAWHDALADPGAIGLTFGGGCWYGHGVNVQGGTARFILTGYSVQ